MDDPRTGRRTRRAAANALQLGAERPLTQPLGQSRRRLCEVGHRRRRNNRQPEDDPGNAAALAPLAAACRETTNHATLRSLNSRLAVVRRLVSLDTILAGPVLWPRSGLTGIQRCHVTVCCSPGRDNPIVSRHSDGIAYPMPGPRPQGDRALTSAERMRRLREKRKAEAADNRQTSRQS